MKLTPQEKIKQRWAKEDGRHKEEAIRALLATFVGRKFLWHLLALARVDAMPFAADPIQTAFNCGEMNVGKKILADIILTDPEGYVKMMKESADERRTRDTELANAGPESDADSADT